MKTVFRTPFIAQKSDFDIHHRHEIMLLGSCFSNNIGEQLKHKKFNTTINPYGISYHPLAIHDQLQLLSADQIKVEERDGLFFSYQFHSELNTQNREVYLSVLKEQIELTKARLKSADYLIITYGTAWVYEVLGSKGIANNCHQQPSNMFTKRLLQVEEIIESWNTTHKFIEEHFGHKKVIFTLSPVRHLKDGFQENQLSKSTLQLAINAICKHQTNRSYFPAYEIMMDDLRDYRFYKDDFLHPNSLAIQYIWNVFGQTYFGTKTLKINDQIEKLSQSVNHRAFQAKSAQHQRFLKKLAEKLMAFESETKINMSAELEHVKEQIV